MNETEKLIANKPASEVVRPVVKDNNTGANPENVDESKLLASVLINGVELFPRVLNNPRIVYASEAEWAVYDDAKSTLADYAVTLNMDNRKTAENCVRALESRGVMLRTRDSKARISNLMAYDLCSDGTANRAAAEGNIVNRATKQAEADCVNIVSKFEKPLADIAKARKDAARAAKIEQFVAVAKSMGMDAKMAREFAESQVK